MNITKETTDFEKLMELMHQKDKVVEVKPQSCDLDGDCLTCGS